MLVSIFESCNRCFLYLRNASSCNCVIVELLTFSKALHIRRCGRVGLFLFSAPTTTFAMYRPATSVVSSIENHTGYSPISFLISSRIYKEAGKVKLNQTMNGSIIPSCIILANSFCAGLTRLEHVLRHIFA